MLERIVIMVCCFMCSVPFLIIGIYNKDNEKTPIVFWSGSENKIRKEIKDMKSYNYEMATLYKKCGILFLLCGVVGLVIPLIGYILIGIMCTVGIYYVYRKYIKILRKNS